MKGYVQVYTGNGKGKTTAAFGLALRAAGAGLRVYIAQFAKGMCYSELEALARYSDLITVEQYGRDCFIGPALTEQDIQAAQQGLAQMRDVVTGDHWDVVILDEATIATQLGLFTVDELLDLVNAKPESMEIIITGRHADARITARADLVTEMREVKHYYAAGVWARPGIEK